MMLKHIAAACLALASFVSFAKAEESNGNSTFFNPILPGFHPDPSCIFVPEWDDTFFCASSSFNAFPGIPIHASKDLQNWKLIGRSEDVIADPSLTQIGNVLNREEQLPRLALTNRSTSGIWAPSLRYHDDTFWLVTTLVDDDRPQTDFSRWDNVIFKGTDPYKPESWSNAVHFNFTGYDTSPFWDTDGKVYIIGAHAWQVSPGIEMAEANLETGEVGEWQVIWNGTGGQAPEGPHVYFKDNWYYLLAAEGGTGLNHMVTMARSKSLEGPYEANPANPVLTNANTTNYFQTLGHADMFHDKNGKWWGVALSTRSGPEYLYYPMGRETVMTAVTWKEGNFPVWTPVSGKMSGWAMPATERDIKGIGPFITEGDDIDFDPGSVLPAHFTYWRYPLSGAFTVSPKCHPNTLKVVPSKLNLTALNGNYAGPTGQAFVGRRQQDTLFSYSVDLDFAPKAIEEEAGVTAFLTQNHHLDLGIVMLPASASNTAFPGTNLTAPEDPEKLVLQVRFRGISYIAVPDPIIAPLPVEWTGNKISLEIKASNMTHYSFSVGPAAARSQMKTILFASNAPVSWGFTGVIVGVYATSNGGEGTTPAYFSKWKYIPEGQFRD